MNGQPEIGDVRLALLVQQDVGRLEVAVDETLLVGIVYRLGDLPGQLGGPDEWQPFRAQNLGQRLSLDVLHHHVGHAVIVKADVVDGHDRRVFEPGDGAGLDEETLHFLRRGQGAATKNFNGHQPAQFGVFRQIDNAESAPTENPRDRIASDLFTGRTLVVVHGPITPLVAQARFDQVLLTQRILELGEPGKRLSDGRGIVRETRLVLLAIRPFALTAAELEVQHHQLAQQGGPLRAAAAEVVLDRRPLGRVPRRLPRALKARTDCFDALVGKSRKIGCVRWLARVHPAKTSVHRVGCCPPLMLSCHPPDARRP